jgi:hypothetical protein
MQDEAINASLFKKGLSENDVVGVIKRQNGLRNPFQKRLD